LTAGAATARVAAKIHPAREARPADRQLDRPEPLS
jgi:hypothetical protein